MKPDRVEIFQEICIGIAILTIVGIILWQIFVVIPEENERHELAYETGVEQIERGEYRAGIETLYPLGDYKDTKRYLALAWELMGET